MAYSKLEKMIIDMATPVAESIGCYIYDTEFVKEGTMKYLRIYADKEDGGISIDECERINRKIGEILDEKDPIKENYVLEVSSPGIERKLKTPWHFEKYNGRQIDVGLYKAVDGSKILSGILKGFADGKVTVETDSTEKTFGLDDVTFVKLHFDF
ncbi:MAG: ribosome maturation factor RimP [Clostridia bacterium]|nr:ribosome maturation factor RimP [Clostridia bacterium]